MKADRPAHPMAVPIVRTDVRPVEEPPQVRPHPCPGCDLLALYRLPGETFSSCGACGLMVTDEDYLARFGPDPIVSSCGVAFHPPVVYYMRLDAIVKIGFTSRIGRRLLDINPQGVLAVEWGARRLESARHNQFAAHHVHGEWFRFCDELAAHIVTVREAWETDMDSSTEAWLSDVGARAWWQPHLIPVDGESNPS